MVFALDTATEADAPRIADIHMAAFHTNGMLLAQFPTPAVRKGLWTSLVDKVVKEIRDPQWEVLVAREADDRVVSFAKWCLPLSESTVYEEEPWVWPEGTNMAILNGWAKKVEQAAKEIMGKTPCYRTFCAIRLSDCDCLHPPGLSFIATDPSYALRGAGSLLVNWGIERSKEENIPIALESRWMLYHSTRDWGFKQRRVFPCPWKASERMVRPSCTRKNVLYTDLRLEYHANKEPCKPDWAAPAVFLVQEPISQCSIPLPPPDRYRQGSCLVFDACAETEYPIVVLPSPETVMDSRA